MLAGCQAGRKGPFTDVTARDQEQPTETAAAGPTTRPAPVVTVAEPAKPAAVTTTDVQASVTNPPATPAISAAPTTEKAVPEMGKLVVLVDEHGNLTRGFAPRRFVGQF